MQRYEKGSQGTGAGRDLVYGGKHVPMCAARALACLLKKTRRQKAWGLSLFAGNVHFVSEHSMLPLTTGHDMVSSEMILPATMKELH
jgi:hypothetical protein